MICSYSFCILSGGDEHFYMFICDLSIFLTSTAFVDTKAKSRVGGKSTYSSLLNLIFEFCL